MPICPCRSGRQAIYISCTHSPKHLLKSSSRDVVTLIHNDQAVFLDKRFYLAVTDQRLKHCDIHITGRRILSSANLPNQAELPPATVLFELWWQRFVNAQKLGERCLPLVQQCLGVYQNQRIDFSLRNQPGSNHSLAECGGGTEYPVMVCQQGTGCGLLVGTQCASKGNMKRAPRAGFVLNGISGPSTVK